MRPSTLAVFLPCFTVAAVNLRLSSGFLVRSGSFWREPIITGCLAECGFADQSCATECQVCVEKLECRGIEDDKCKGCRRLAHIGRLATKDAKNNIAIDSGGASLVHESVRTRLEVAHLQALRHKRFLRRLQAGILKFQRQAEWAAEERLKQRSRLHDAKSILKHAEEEVAAWELRSARKLKATRARAREMRSELLHAEADLDESKKKVRVLRQKLKRAKSTEERASALKRLNAAKNEAVKVRRLAATRRRVVELVESKLQNEERDAEWLSKGTDKKRDAANDAVEVAVTQMHAARGMERFSRERLERAKLRYRKAAVTEEKLHEKVVQLEADFQKSPLPQTVGPL